MTATTPHSAERASPRRGTHAVDYQAVYGVEAADHADWTILRWLLRYPFQRAEDLALALRLTPASAYRRVARQDQLGLTECLTPASLGRGSCRLYYLSNLGLHALAGHLGADPTQLVRACGSDERGLLRLLPRLPALMTLQSFVNGLITGASTALGTAGKPAIVRWHWVRDWRQRFDFRERETTCFADAAVVLHASPTMPPGTGEASGTHRAGAARPAADRWYVPLVLLDTGLGDRRLLSRRIDALLRYRESSERWPVYGHFPLVLVLTSGPHREALWQHIVAERAATQGVPLAGAVTSVHDLWGGAPCDPWDMRWQELASGASRRLEQLLSPLPGDAVPSTLRTVPSALAEFAGPEPLHGGLPNSSQRPPRAIRGDFAQRGHEMLTGKPAAPAHAAQERVITAVLAPALSRQQWRALELLFAHPLLSTEELAAALEVDEESVERYLRPLRRSGCIRAIERPEDVRLHLAPRGLRLIAAAYHLSARSIMVSETETGAVGEQRGLRALRHHLDHTAEVYSFFTALLRTAESERLAGRNHELLWWETGSACRRRYRYQGRWHNLSPDGAGAYQVDHHCLRFWLEWDRGTMRSRDLREKLAAYAQYVVSGEWQAEGPGGGLPTLLIVVPDPSQEARLTQVTRETLADLTQLRTFVATASRLQACSPLAPIWTSITPGADSSQILAAEALFCSVFT